MAMASNSFISDFTARLLVAAVGVTGPFGALLAFVLSVFIKKGMDQGLVLIDIQIDKIKEVIKENEWINAAEKAYRKASSQKKLTEEEKDAIRKEYLAALERYATYGNGMRDH